VPDPFDHTAALAAADACEAAASRVADTRRGLSGDARSATDGWLGPHRDRFDRDLTRAVDRAEQVERRLRRCSDALRERARA
jgi:hypothetical protein